MYGGNSEREQERHRIRSKEITEMIEMQEERFEKELTNITNAFSSTDKIK